MKLIRVNPDSPSGKCPNRPLPTLAVQHAMAAVLTPDAGPSAATVIGAPMTYGQGKPGTDHGPRMLRDAGLISGTPAPAPAPAPCAPCLRARGHASHAMPMSPPSFAPVCQYASSSPSQRPSPQIAPGVSGSVARARGVPQLVLPPPHTQTPLLGRPAADTALAPETPSGRAARRARDTGLAGGGAELRQLWWEVEDRGDLLFAPPSVVDPQPGPPRSPGCARVRNSFAVPEGERGQGGER